MSDETPTTQAEMPQYQCFKKVRALKIAYIVYQHTMVKGAVLHFHDKEYEPLYVNENYVLKHDPRAGGYYIVYKDGYRSWFPADAFEFGYTLI